MDTSKGVFYDVALPANVSQRGRARDQCFAIVLDDVFSREECNKIIERANPLLQYVREAQHEVAGEMYQIKLLKPRNYRLALFEDRELSDKIYNSLQERAGPALASFTDRVKCGSPLGVNRRLRVLGYREGDQFEPHYDQCIRDEERSQESLITILLYLNDGESDLSVDKADTQADAMDLLADYTDLSVVDSTHVSADIEKVSGEFSGGDTLFLDSLNPSVAPSAIRPRAGRVVLFEHELYHSGAPVKATRRPVTSHGRTGSKYVLRTEIMYDAETVERSNYSSNTSDGNSNVCTTVAQVLRKLELATREAENLHVAVHENPSVDTPTAKLFQEIESLLESAGLLTSLIAFRAPGRIAVMAILEDLGVPEPHLGDLVNAAFEDLEQ